MNHFQIRKDTAGCTNTIFLNSAGSSLMPRPVLEKMTAYLAEEEQWGGYETAARHSYEIRQFYTETGKLLNCPAANIAFSGSATHAYFQALSAVPFQKGDLILTTTNDYASNQIAFLSLKQRLGVEIIRAGNLPDGEVDLAHFEALIRKQRPKLVAITHIPTNSGLVQPASEIGRICRKYEVWFLLDACQSVGQLVVDVQEIDCDFLSVTGRKFLRGPRGTGFLYVSERALQAGLAPLLIDMQGADWTVEKEFQLQSGAKRFELWENSYANLIGLKEAIAYANRVGMQNIYTYNQRLLKLLRAKMEEVPGMLLLDKGTERSNILTYQIKGSSLDRLESGLRNANVTYSVSRKTNSLLDFQEKGVDWAIRFSPHYFNTEDEMERVTEILKAIM